MQKIILDVIPNGVCPRVYVNQYDIGREFQISFKEGLGSYYFQNNLTFTINGRKSDNHIFEYTEADKWDSTHYVITKSGSGASTKVTIGTTEQMTAAPGETDVQLIFNDSTNAVIGTLSFIMVVQECPGIEGDPSESVVPNVVRSVNNVRPGATGNVYLPLCEIDGINDNVAYTEKTREMGTQHVAGEFVFVDSDNQLYEITSTINSGGTLTPGTNATACSIGDVLRQLNSDIANLIGENPTSISYCNGFLNFGSGVTNPTAIAQKLLTDITIPSGTVSNISVIVLTNSLWQIDGYCNDGKTFASLTLKRYDGSFYLFYRSGTTDTLKTISTT